MKEIPLSKTGKNAGKFVALVDDEDYERVMQYNWCLWSHKKRNIFYAKTIINKKIVYLHRFLIRTPFLIIDHIDGNGLNCQNKNLRPSNYSLNGANRNKTKLNKSLYKGVSIITRNRNNKIYHYITANIKYNNKHIHLGIFKTTKEAAIAYNKKAMELFGEFARLNVI